MIKLRNRSEFLIDLSVPGTQTATTNKRTFVVPFACQIKSIYALLGAAGTTGSQIVEIKKNGTTIFSNATKLTFATTVAAATYGPLTADPTSLAKGDVLTVDVTQIHTTPAVNLNLLIVLQRFRATGLVPATVTGGIGLDAE